MTTDPADLDRDDYFDRMGTETTGRFDVTPLFGNPETFAGLRADLAAGIPEDVDPAAVVGPDALGFVLGSALAVDLGVGFVPVRKGGKLPYTDAELHRRTVTDYSGEEKTLELRRGALGDGDSVVLVDDWVETGAQMLATADLVEAAGASVAAVLAIGVDHTEETAPLYDRYPVHGVC